MDNNADTPTIASLVFGGIFSMIPLAIWVFLVLTPSQRARVKAFVCAALRAFAIAAGYCFCIVFYPFFTILHHVDKNWGVWPVWLWGRQRPDPAGDARGADRGDHAVVSDVSDFELDPATLAEQKPAEDKAV